MKTNSISNENNVNLAIQSAFRKKWIIIGAFFLVIALIAMSIIFHQVRLSHEKILAKEFAEIDSIYNQETVDFQKKQADQVEKDKAAKTVTPPDQNVEPDYTQSMQKFSDFALKNPQSPYAWEAAIRAASYYISKNNYEVAQKDLESILPFSSNQQLIQIKVRTTLAGIYVRENNVSKAIEELTIVQNYPKNPYPDQSRYLKAEILLTSGNKDEAKKVLNEIISNAEAHPNTNSLENNVGHQAKILLNKIGL